MEKVLAACVIALVLFLVLRRKLENQGALVPAALRAKPTSVTTSAAVLHAVKEELSRRAQCRIELTSVKTLSAVQIEKNTVYELTAFLFDTCTLAQTFERMRVSLSEDGRITLSGRSIVTPVAMATASKEPSLADTVSGITAAGGRPLEIDKKIGVGYTMMQTKPFDTSDVAAYPHQTVETPQLYARAPPEIPEVLDFRIFNEMTTQPLQDLQNASQEQSLLRIMYS